MAILRNVLVFLIALTVAGMLPAAHSMPVDEADAACAAQSILCGQRARLVRYAPLWTMLCGAAWPPWLWFPY